MLRLFNESCALKMGVLGINFKTASLHLREFIARGADRLSGEKGLFFPHPTVLLSTCNRTEIYFSGDDLASVHSELLALLRLYIDEPFEYRLYSYFGIDCFAHLCRVASGLDSAILAETEIQRQVKVAYLQSAQRSRLPPCVHYAFQKALKVGKTVRSSLSLERSPSLAGTIFTLSKAFWGDLASVNVLFVGYSELNRSLASYFLHRGVTDLTLCTKDPTRVKQSGCIVVGREVLPEWHQFQLVICASKAGEYLISNGSRSRHLLFDLSVPRNIDPAVGLSSQLYNIEQINQFMEHSQLAQSIDLDRCEEFVKTSVLNLARIYRDKQRAVHAV